MLLLVQTLFSCSHIFSTTLMELKLNTNHGFKLKFVMIMFLSPIKYIYISR